MPGPLNSLAGLRNNILTLFFGPDDMVDPSCCSNIIESMHNEMTANENISDQFTNANNDGDRGGSTGLDEDYAWEHFVPRVIAYNWTTLRSTDDCTRCEIIRDDSHFNDYKTMLYNLGFIVPTFVDIHMHLVDELPFEVSGSNEEEHGSQMELRTLHV